MNIIETKIHPHSAFDFNELITTAQREDTIVLEKIHIMASFKQKALMCNTDKNIFTITSDTKNCTDKDNIFIICIKDHPEILNFCLTKLQQNNHREYADVLIVDDRPCNTDNQKIAEKYKCMYISIHNTLNVFNYSMINNIAAGFAKLLNKKRIIFWNSDVWSDNQHTIKKLINKHIQHKSSISGTKLVYPSQEEYNNIFGKYEHVLKNKLDSSFLTIQHGGIIFVPSFSPVYQNRLSFMPAHQWRFYDRYYDLASIDTRCFAVTGACHIIDVDDFVSLGGYNCCMLTAYQDIDICQRAVQKEMSVHYFGSQTLFHGETITNEDGRKLKKSPLAASDMIIYDLLWHKNTAKLLGISI